MNRILSRPATCGDREARRRADLADDGDDPVALDHPLAPWSTRSAGLTLSSAEQLDLAAEHAAGGVDLLDGEVDAHHGVLAQRAEEAGARRQVPDTDDVGVCPDDGGRPKRRQGRRPAEPFRIARRVNPFP